MRGLKAFLIGVLVVLIFSLVMSGCSTLERASQNPLLVRIAVDQAVRGYVLAGVEAEEVYTRKQNLIGAMTGTLAFIDSSANANVGDVLVALVAAMDWEQLTITDQLIVIETVSFVQSALNARVRAGELESDAILLLRDIVQGAIDSARYL